MPDYEKIAAKLKVASDVVEVEIPADQAEAAQKVNGIYLPLSHEKYQGIAGQKGYIQDEKRITHTRYSHDSMIDLILCDPGISQIEIAKQFGRSQNWISRIIGSDAFQAALAKRRDELTDPFLVATVEERFRGLAFQSLDILAEKLETSRNTDLALKSLDISVKALGFGARNAGPQQNNQFIIQLPAKATDSATWAEDNLKKIGNG